MVVVAEGDQKETPAECPEAVTEANEDFITAAASGGTSGNGRLGSQSRGCSRPWLNTAAGAVLWVVCVVWCVVCGGVGGGARAGMGRW